MHIYTRTDINTDAGIKESEWTESNLTKGDPSGFWQFARSHWSLVSRSWLLVPKRPLILRARVQDDFEILNNNLGCNCLGPSTVGRQLASQCWPASGVPTLPHSPVRDWWTGEN